ncbi:MAG: serine--tRNA ligase [Candidatus Yanofskybacteria bacterium RIFCSPHIGHO2_02_FULL_46_19]|uniref:Serine--tRNA ligase n=1 Tax=Candidatus Yanofskybacteria bacterium RIFCSPHIGHO2_02_FULL_46_19 TaxID=1802684 RepID=A0A1F8FS50_9BACT|nr:MAG: serine--tRNA ligase [Candidatus Yanofskybacteria bacterium RIFCSPHIGHO2_02_FULL_46_19]
MLDIKFIRENSDLVREAARKKHTDFDIERFLALDEKRRALIADVDEMRRTHREESEKTSKTQGAERDALISQLKEGKDKISHKEFELRTIENEFSELMLQVPNIPDPSVPEGNSDADNQEIRVWNPRSSTPSVAELGGRDYLTLMKEHDMLDLERGTKVSGFRGYFLKNDGALLSFALWRFALDFMVKRGFIPFIAPALVREENLIGTGHFPKSREDVYKTENDDLYLSGTAEIPMTGYFRDEVLREDELPKTFVAFSPCYRREAGSYGKDTKGIFRTHEFYKVEQFVLCKNDHQESVRWHEEITKNSEELLQALEVPYRIVVNCTGDIGQAHVKTYDIESWFPSENKYRETHSSSYYHDFQTRRFNIKYRDSEGKLRFAHSLNNTALATPRILEQFLENHQEPSGSIEIPKALQPYMGKEKIA